MSVLLSIASALLHCPTCGAPEVVTGSTCPKGIACPTCSAAPGQRCRRPSGHYADALHAARIAQAERFDAARGVTYE